MADENTPAFYPRVGNIRRKDFKPAQPMPFIEDPRAMDLPQYGDVDLSVPSKENLEMSRRMAERDAQLRRQREADRSRLEKLAGGVQAGRFLGSALTQGINSIPTRIFKGDEAADKFMQERMYKPEQPLAYEYAGDVGDMLERLETEYKIPPVLPEAVALQYLTGPATSQAMKAAGKGAQALEKRLDPMVTQALDRGGLQRDLLLGMGTQSNVVKPKGGVNISNNPDTMMLELGNKAPMKASEALGKIEGRPLKITQSDRTKVGGGYLGGPGFSGLQLTEPEYRAAEAAWGVQNAGTAKTILGGGKKGDNPVYAAMIGTPTQHQSNQMVFDKLYGDFKKAAKRGELTPELRDLINTRLAASVDKKGNPVFPADVDILDKNFKNIADTFSRRSIAGHLMGGVQVGGKKGQIIDYDKIIRNTTDPALIDQPTGALGNRLFTLSGGIIDRPDLHPAFPAILQGEDLGVTFTPVERNLVMKDFVNKTMREKGRKPGYMDYTRGNPPTQLITEDILTELQKLGLKKGGAVKKAEGGYLKKPAAYINGDEFVNAAKKYGIKDSMNNLNKIVDLVNKGLSVDDAARQVADSGMHKAAGGAIRGDDLILEERPL
jgi:hypothetical protein